eukprot:COSAG02_NODE_61961_length_267_cov_0.619048_2_plen_69_part_01
MNDRPGATLRLVHIYYTALHIHPSLDDVGSSPYQQHQLQTERGLERFSLLLELALQISKPCSQREIRLL